jgi:hypothetical protein
MGKVAGPYTAQFNPFKVRCAAEIKDSVIRGDSHTSELLTCWPR